MGAEAEAGARVADGWYRRVAPLIQPIFGGWWIAVGLQAVTVPWPVAIVAGILAGASAFLVARRRRALRSVERPQLATRHAQTLTVGQLLLSVALSIVLAVADVAELTLPLVVLTVGVLLAWLSSPDQRRSQRLVAAALVAVPLVGLLLFNGDALVASVGLVCGPILLSSALSTHGG